MEKQGANIIRECGILRAKQAYNEAIALVEDNIERIDPEFRARAWLEAFQTARDKGDRSLARRYAILANTGADQQHREKDALGQSGKGLDIISACANLRSKGLFNETIELIEQNISQIDPKLHVQAWYEAFYAAQAKGDTEQAKRFVISIATADPSALTSAENA